MAKAELAYSWLFAKYPLELASEANISLFSIRLPATG
jgi:hypothetical protein